MNKGIHPLGHLAFMLWLAISVHASAQSVRVAVAGDSSLANLVDVTTSDLSNLHELSVLDRADLDKLGQEQEIEAVLDAKDFSPVRLLPADGLVLLRAVTTDGKTGVFARLVAVQPGVILREVALPDNADPLTQAQALEKEFAPYWSKLAAIQKGKITALSLLGLRFEVDAPETRDMERSINMLLASRLSAEPDVLVLERWRLNDVVFEKTLAPQPPSPFWTGSSLIDGSMRWEKSNNRVEVTLRLRPPQGPEVSIEDGDTSQNLPALVERVADKIRGGASAAGAWTPADEARHFADLGKWCLDNGLAQEGTEAMETALALGDDNRVTRVLQVKAYAIAAYPKEPRYFFPHYDFYSAKVITPDTLDQRVEAARMAAMLMSNDLEDNHDTSASTSSPDDPASLGVLVLENCLGSFRAAYEQGFSQSHPEVVAELRHAIQKLIGELDARLLPSPNSEARQAYFRHRDYYAGLWHETPETTVAFYRENLGPGMDGSGIRASLYQYDTVHPPFLDGDAVTDKDQESRLLHAAPEFCGTPYIVAWDGRPANDVATIWRKFLDELAASSDPVLEADALKLELKSTLSDAGRNACVAHYADFVQQHADSLSGPRAEAFAAGCDSFFYWAADRRDNAEARHKLSALYLDLLKRHAKVPPAWIAAGTRFLFGGDRITNDEARELLSAIDDYTAWYGSSPSPERPLLHALGEMRQTIFRSRTELMPAAQDGDFLPVTRFWDSGPQATGFEAHMSPRLLHVSQSSLTVSENRIWFMTQKPPYRIFGVDPATLKVDFTLTLPDELESRKTGVRLNVQSLDVSPQWLAVGVDDRCFLCSRADNQWRELDLPPFIYKPRFVNQELYLLYRPAYDPGTNQPTSEGSGLIHVVLPTAAVENIVSSRRIPPQTALDGKPLGEPLDLWMTQKGLTLAVGAFQAYATPLGKNAWTLLTSVPARCDVRLTAGGALIGADKTKDFFAQLGFIGADGSALLLSNPDDAAKYPPGKPLWNLPGEIRSTPPANLEQISPIMRGDDLVLYNNVQNGLADGKEASLYYFAKGQKDGVKIPLAFDIATMKSSRPGWVQTPTPVLNFWGLQATDYGLVIYGLGDPGFWVIPWGDIDAYRAKGGPAAAPSTSPPAAE